MIGLVKCVFLYGVFDGSMCFLLTAANGHSECLRMLLCSEGGADLVNVTDAEGQYVSAYGSFTVVLFLIFCLFTCK